jgi:aryl-alcohol dehydrogenase-like predicted oxidoreductase
METRQLGRTGNMSSIAFFGSVAFWHQDQATADRALNLAKEYGVNHIDVAPQYGNAQEVVGNWLKPQRDQFFIGCKTLERQRDAAFDDLHNSLKLLHTDHVDLYQMHAVSTLEILDEAFAPGGVMETLVQAREQGKTRWLGLTSHGMLAPSIEIEALNRFDFDTVMFPLNPRLYANPDYRRDVDELLRIARERNVGVLTIKAAAKGPRTETGLTQRPDPWYLPYGDLENISLGYNYVLSQPGVASTATVGNVDYLELCLKAAANFTPMSAEEQAALVARRAEEEELIFAGPQFVTPPDQPGD